MENDGWVLALLVDGQTTRTVPVRPRQPYVDVPADGRYVACGYDGRTGMAIYRKAGRRVVDTSRMRRAACDDGCEGVLTLLRNLDGSIVVSGTTFGEWPPAELARDGRTYRLVDESDGAPADCLFYDEGDAVLEANERRLGEPLDAELRLTEAQVTQE
jgi:hypothetical protein